MLLIKIGVINTVEHTLQIRHLSHKNNPNCRCYYNVHFTDEKTGAEMLSNLLKIKCLAFSRETD
jgi:hypothetical protein